MLGEQFFVMLALTLIQIYKQIKTNKMSKNIIMPLTDFQNNIDLQIEINGAETNMVKMVVDDTYFSANSSFFTNATELVQDGDDVKAISCTL